MSDNFTQFKQKYKFWFYFRKCIFQVILPIFLAFLSLIDFMNQPNNKSQTHLYFYTSFILLIYTGLRYVIQYIFDLCSETIIFKKEFNIDYNTTNLMTMTNLDFQHISVIKRIFKLKYSKNIYFCYLTKICWVLGLDCPILIPQYIVTKITGENHITEENEETFLHTTINYLQSFQPQIYEVTPLNTGYNHIDIINESAIPNHVITKNDKNICDVQCELFGGKNNLDIRRSIEQKSTNLSIIDH